MTDDGALADPKTEAPGERYAESLLYDFAKFLTTLSLLALGGVLTLTQAVDRADIKLFNIVLVLGSIALAGVLAMSTANALVDARSAGREPHPALRTMIKAAMALLGVGTGGFLMIWLDTLI